MFNIQQIEEENKKLFVNLGPLKLRETVGNCFVAYAEIGGLAIHQLSRNPRIFTNIKGHTDRERIRSEKKLSPQLGS